MKISTQDAQWMDYPFTNPQKILYPVIKLTKQNLAQYYHRIANQMLPYVVNRPLTLVRCPQGQGQKCFYQKHKNQIDLPGLYTINIKEKMTSDSYFYIKNEEGLMALVQLDVLEIHLWGCHIKNIEKPDMITFDLDPGEEVEWKTVVETAFFIKENLEKINLTSFVKTTGGKGLHVVLPIKPQYSWEQVEVFTKTFVDYLVSLRPHLYIATMRKSKRRGKIFIDYLRNQRGSTAVAVYSTRAKENATISTPLTWDELSFKINADTFNVINIFKRLDKIKQHPWEGFLTIHQSLKFPKR